MERPVPGSAEESADVRALIRRTGRIGFRVEDVVSFLAVSRLESFTKAAVPLHVTQPAVSARIARLERDLGLSLLDRSTRPATLTRDGARLLPVADRLVRLLVEFREG